MKKTSLFLAALFALVSFTASKAEAAYLPFEDEFSSGIDMGFMTAGYEGPIDTKPTRSGIYDRTLDGELAQNTRITFSYSLTQPLVGTLTPEQLDTIFGEVYAEPNQGNPSSNYLVEKLHNTAMDLFTVIISNFSNTGTVWFESALKLSLYKGEVISSYETTAVPLPAALPLFGLGLIGLAGIKRLKKNKASA